LAALVIWRRKKNCGAYTFGLVWAQQVSEEGANTEG